MKRAFETAECEEVRNSIFWELRYEKHENQMKGCGVELRVYNAYMFNELEYSFVLIFSFVLIIIFNLLIAGSNGYNVVVVRCSEL